MTATREIKAEAIRLGFDVVGVASASEPWDEGERLARFVELGWHGDMAWMAETLERRLHPTAMWTEAKSAVVLGLNYGPEHDPLAALDARDRAAISVYAHGSDYHDLIKKRLKALARFIVTRWGGELKVFVDTAPLLEKALAERAGIGWRGKHTNLVSRDKGSWLFLGSVLTTLDLDLDAAEADHCGACRRCLDVCPTDAFPEPYRLDARRCLSYLTIEHKGPIPTEFRVAMGNRVYGCDDCLAVCPWNKFAETARETALHARDALRAPRLEDLVALDDATFRALFAGSPIKRIGRDRFLRNALIAIGNSNDPTLADAVEARLEDEVALVRGAAVWALWRLDPARFAAARDRLEALETQAEVRAEWALGAQLIAGGAA